jgi:hypothetical protein
VSSPSFIFQLSTVNRIALRVSIHPSYRTNQNHRANVALIFVSSPLQKSFKILNVLLHQVPEMPMELFPLMPTTNLPTNATCNLFGWGQISTNSRSEEVRIYNSDFCDPEHPQVSCSTFDTLQDEVCTAQLGSPVMCNSNTQFAGFMTSDGCINDGSRISISYHSVNTFQRWISEVILIDTFNRNVQEGLTASVVQFTPRVGGWDRIRCVGTLINDYHMLTTANCVILPENSQFVIGVNTNWVGLAGGRVTQEPEEIFVNPNFNANYPLNSNIAVIRVSYCLFEMLDV